MEIRRIVTGTSPDGKAVFDSDAVAPGNYKFANVPGFETSLLWATDAFAGHKEKHGRDPAGEATSWVPGKSGTRLMVITFPPDSVMASSAFDPAAAGAEYMTALPGLAECFEPASPGMHTTATVDYGMLLEGEIHLELDDGQSKRLTPRDLVVQRGTRHAWRNRSNQPATMLFVLVGEST